MSQIVRKVQTALTANQTINNDLQGTDIEYVGPCLVSLWASEKAASVSMTLKNGAAQTVADGAVPNVEASAGVVDNQKDQLVDQVLLPQGGHLILKLVEQGGVANYVNYRLVAELIPAGA